jgi:hypothetical protein
LSLKPKKYGPGGLRRNPPAITLCSNAAATLEADDRAAIKKVPPLDSAALAIPARPLPKTIEGHASAAPNAAALLIACRLSLC